MKSEATIGSKIFRGSVKSARANANWIIEGTDFGAFTHVVSCI